MLALTACAQPRTQGVAVEVPAEGPTRNIDILVTRNGFEPALVVAHQGDVVRLTFTRTAARTCATSVIVWLSQDHTIERPLPLGVPVSLTLELRNAGDIGFACPMHMYGGRVAIRPPGN